MPLFFIVILYIFLFLIFKDDIIIQDHSNTSHVSITQAATVVAGGFMVGALTTPDISRYCKNQNHLFWMITLCIVVGEFIINGISIYIAHRLNTADIVTIMTHNAGIIGLASIILSVIKVNDVNLYSASLGSANALQAFTGKKWEYFKLMLVDYYILKTSRKILDESREKGLLPDDSSTPLIGWSAIIACIIGTVVGIVFNFGIPSLNSILTSGMAYWLLMKITNKNRGQFSDP